MITMMNNKEVTDNCPAAFVKQTDPETVICDVGGLKAADWEEFKNGNEKSGQCRCQNSCDCLVEDLYAYDVTKNEGDLGYETRETTTHLLTKDGLEFPPKNEDGESLTCGLYTFKDDTTARGPETFKADFDVSSGADCSSTRHKTISRSLDAMIPLLFARYPDTPKDPPTKLRSPGTPCRTRTYASLTAPAV